MVSVSSGMKDPMDAELSKEKARDSIRSFHKYILKAHHGVHYTKMVHTRSLTLQGSQSSGEIGMQMAE